MKGGAATERARKLRRLTALAALCALAAYVQLADGAAGARAATVVMLYRDGRTGLVNNRFLTGAAANPNLPAMPAAPGLPPAPATGLSLTTRTLVPLAQVARAGQLAKRRKHPHRPPLITFAQALQKLNRSGALATVTYLADLRAWRAALIEERHIARWRAAQLTDVTATFDEMATYHQITVSRLPVLMLTLANNAAYWRSGRPLANGTSVQFQGSELVWEYYAGSGIQLQVLHTFGEGDGFHEAGPSDYPKLVTLMSEMIPLAVRRAGGLAWEYYFNWEGGRPPWVSAMAQATGLE
ncbi:MAG: hypothetical protein M0T77_06240, partial [Actinomycetota bacterium]|nr:hypothetical protein [Actinomycetota bacterium]